MATMIALILGLLSQLGPAAVDRDGDGLSDFQEQHKYLTNPGLADSDGDGIPDGDWEERREYQYTVRSIVEVMRPVTPEYLNDDYQDIKVLETTDTHLKLEVIHYPFNRVAEAIKADPTWRKTAASMKEWLTPGPTSDWDESLSAEISSAMAKDGHDLQLMNDKELAETASRWLMKNTQFSNNFFSYVIAVDGAGKPSVPESMAESIERRLELAGRSLEEQFEREMSSKGMFRHREHGSCTSSAIFLNGCLRALGLPTRIVLCIPVLDASDPKELDLLQKGISHHALRRELTASMAGLRNSWAAHTFNEVYVGGRWRRLNYSKLGQNIQDPNCFGLMTHVATFSDWAEGKTWETIGPRQENQDYNDTFGFRNPYSCIDLSDQFGPHSELENPLSPKIEGRIVAVHWFDAQALPSSIRKAMQRPDRWGLMVQAEGLRNWPATQTFLKEVDLEVELVRDGDANLKLKMDSGCVWGVKDGGAYIALPISESNRKRLKSGSEYRFKPCNSSESSTWRLPDAGLRIVAR